MKSIMIFLCLSFLTHGAMAKAKNDSEMATLEFHGIEVEPYKMDGKRLNKNKHSIKVKPGKHVVDVYLDWGGRGKSSDTKSACFVAKAGKQYLMGADTDGEKYYSDWSPYVIETSPYGTLVNFLSLGFGRKLLTCD